MHRIIGKFQLDVTDEQEVRMPARAEILSADMQKGVLCLWAIIDKEKPMVNRRFVVAGTGNPLPDSCDTVSHVTTVQAGRFVWHIFDLGEV